MRDAGVSRHPRQQIAAHPCHVSRSRNPFTGVCVWQSAKMRIELLALLFCGLEVAARNINRTAAPGAKVNRAKVTSQKITGMFEVIPKIVAHKPMVNTNLSKYELSAIEGINIFDFFARSTYFFDDKF
jgi:hypothetical protein